MQVSPTVTNRQRQQQAIRASLVVANRLGLTGVDPLILKDSNHTNIHLLPFAIVARVSQIATSDTILALARELAIAHHLADAGTPTVTPTPDVPPGPYVDQGMALTLWQYESHAYATDDDAAAAATALQAVHRSLATYAGELPSFTKAIDSCRRSLEDAATLPALSSADRAFLCTEHDRLRALLASFVVSPRALHGDPHLGNLLMTSSGPRWADWESACIGPLEWDLSCLPDATLDVFGDVDGELLALVRDLRSVCVAVWCWADPDRAPEKREAAEFHLQRLRDRPRAASAT
jgi:hypothetical protein